MIRASIQQALLRAISEANGQISLADVRTTELIATNVHLDSGSLFVGKIISLTDEMLLADLMRVAVEKAIIDSAGSSDLYVAHLFKNVSDVVSTGTVLDAAAIQFAKNVSEMAEASDSFSFDIDTVYADAWSATDIAQIHFQPAYSDAASSTDSYLWSFSKNLSEAPQITDAQIFTVNKSLTDTPLAADVFSRVVQYVRTFSDSVSVGDSISPSIIEGLNQFPQNTAGATDVAALDYSKPISESWSATDVYAFSFSKPVSEAPSVSEQISKAVDPFKSDSAGFTDSQLFEFGKGFSEQADASETTVFSLALVKTETPSVTDTFAKSFSKVIADTADISDAFSLEEVVNPSNTANAIDAAAFSFGANKSNTFDAADAYAAAFSKTLEDPANCSDTGVLLAQGYVSSTDYFSDDFVGVKRTLT